MSLIGAIKPVRALSIIFFNSWPIYIELVQKKFLGILYIFLTTGVGFIIKLFIVFLALGEYNYFCPLRS